MNEKNRGLSGEITLETAIVMSLIMVIMIVLVCFTLYTHDALVIKAYAYGAANESIGEEEAVFRQKVQEQVEQAPLFVMKPSVKIEKKLDSYRVTVKGTCHLKVFGFEKFFSEGFEPKSMNIEKNMSTSLLYIAREISEQVERKNENGN
ncbi:MAG: hypothetical protein K6G64_05815 [Eubacterium sp.]|nr:hypothetical protein [Eubacterium sp.]